MKVFQFKYLLYLKRKRTIPILIGIFCFLVLGAITYNYFYKNYIKYLVEEKYIDRVNLFYLNKNGDTIRTVIATPDIYSCDSLKKYWELDYKGETAYINFKHVFIGSNNNNNPVSLKGYTKDKQFAIIILADYNNAKISYEEYYVYFKCIQK